MLIFSIKLYLLLLIYILLMPMALAVWLVIITVFKKGVYNYFIKQFNTLNWVFVQMQLKFNQLYYKKWINMFTFTS